MIRLIHDRTPDIRIRDWRFAKIEPGLTAQTTAFGTVEIDEKYNACLSFDQFETLLADLLHEGMHASDSFLQRWRDRRAEPENSINHQAILNRVEWEVGSTILKPIFPPGKSWDDYRTNQSSIKFGIKLWGIGNLTQLGIPYNRAPINENLKSLYEKLYP